MLARAWRLIVLSETKSKTYFGVVSSIVLHCQVYLRGVFDLIDLEICFNGQIDMIMACNGSLIDVHVNWFCEIDYDCHSQKNDYCQGVDFVFCLHDILSIEYERHAVMAWRY